MSTANELDIHFPRPPRRLNPDMYGQHEAWEVARFGPEGDMGGSEVQVFTGLSIVGTPWNAIYVNRKLEFWLDEFELGDLQTILAKAVRIYIRECRKLMGETSN